MGLTDGKVHEHHFPCLALGSQHVAEHFVLDIYKKPRLDDVEWYQAPMKAIFLALVLAVWSLWDSSNRRVLQGHLQSSQLFV